MPKVPFFAQMEVTECGAACLAMVLGYHGHHAGLLAVREACGVSRDGASAAAILRAARRYGLEGSGYRVELDDIEAGALPVILHWELNHFVVATRVSARGFEILDPAVGPRFVPRQRADEAFSGVMLAFRPGKGFEKKAASKPERGRYFELVGSAFAGLGLTALGALLLELIGLIFPVASQVAIDFIVRPKQPRFLFALAGALLVATGLRFALALARNRILGGLRISLDTQLVTRFVGHLTRLPLSFLNQRGLGDLANRTEAHTSIREIMRSLATTALDALLVLSYSALMLAYDLRLGASVLLITGLRLSVALLVQRWIRDDVATEVLAEGREASALAEAFSAPEAIKAFAAEPLVRGRYVDAITSRSNAAVHRERVEYNAQSLLSFLDACCLALIYGFGGHLVASGEITLGVLSAFVAMALLIGVPLQSVVRAAAAIPQLRQLLRRLDDIWEARPEHDGSIDPGRLDGAITVDAVTVRHGGGTAILNELSLSLVPGERVAIVGPSGSGKTTLAQVMAGLLTPSSGAVWLDRHPLGTLERSKVFAQIGLVPPEPILLDASVRENIALGDPERSLAEIVRAARDACIDADIIALSDGYETRLGRGGVRLSGGQAQRITIARALLKAPRIMLLDEATSSLDAGLEERILANVRRRGCTQVIISHRIAAMRHVDRIIVVAAGRVVDQGPFGVLRQRCGFFREMIEANAEAAL
jgi:ATP-binding cassette, subfamily B, bacterial